MGIAALVARLVGIEPIVGAFLIGLAFNRFVPARTVIADRIQVLGATVFIPAFLISTGMLLDPLALLTDAAHAAARGRVPRCDGRHEVRARSSPGSRCGRSRRSAT
jgi:Kef-type K+ transport system membrane component KefB